MNDLVQEVTKKLGPMTRVAKEHVQPADAEFFGFPVGYAPDPVNYRRSYLVETGVSLEPGGTSARALPG